MLADVKHLVTKSLKDCLAVCLLVAIALTLFICTDDGLLLKLYPFDLLTFSDCTVPTRSPAPHHAAWPSGVTDHRSAGGPGQRGRDCCDHGEQWAELAQGGAGPSGEVVWIG